MLIPLAASVVALMLQTSPESAPEARIPAIIDPMDWIFHSSSGSRGTYTFYKFHPTEPIVWLRSEHIDSRAWSRLEEYRVNCNRRTITWVTHSTFMGLNMRTPLHSYEMNERMPYNPNGLFGLAVKKICDS